jgi:PhzF family phenazine biosynthesis protein
MKFWTIDSFTNQPFKGNPAGVCVVEKFPDSVLMQQIANEIHLSETAFVVHKTGAQYDIRWFTPATEVELCGHATLAAAHAVWHELHIPHNTIHFNSLSGILIAARNEHEITLDFPAYTNATVDIPDDLTDALGITPIALHKAHDDWIVELEHFSDVVALQPNITQLSQINCRGIIVTAKGNSQYDFVSRFFAPKVGVDEDPVTGSAHCKLAPYWAQRLNKNSMIAYQASKRGGVVTVRFENNRVFLTGEAVTMIQGDILL